MLKAYIAENQLKFGEDSTIGKKWHDRIVGANHVVY
jgi:hypothetical protein